MRTFLVKRGKFEGEHKIYDSPKELYEHEKIDFVRKPWLSEDTKVGEWCVMDDGFIAQCLHRYPLVTKSTGYVVDVYRFAFGSRAVYNRKRDGKRVGKLFYTTNPSANKSALVSQGYDRAIGGSYDSRKKLWVNLVVDGIDPLDASRTVYKGLPDHKLVSITSKLIENTKIRSKIVDALVPFKEELELELAEAGRGTLNQEIAMSIAELTSSERKTTKDKVAVIKLLIDVGLLTGDLTKKTSATKIVEANDTEFKEVLPPRLGSE